MNANRHDVESDGAKPRDHAHPTQPPLAPRISRLAILDRGGADARPDPCLCDDRLPVVEARQTRESAYARGECALVSKPTQPNAAGDRLCVGFFCFDRLSMGVIMPGTFSDRRRFLSICTATLMTLMTGLILAPALAFVTSPLRRRRGTAAAADEFADAGAIDSIPLGTWTLLPIEIVRQDGWVKTRQSRSVWALVNGTAPLDVKVLSPICTHLGCPVGWSADSAQFRCPCHGGTFNKEGSLVSGPPPRALDTLESQIRDGHLWVRWQDFRIGVHERVAVQV